MKQISTQDCQKFHEVLKKLIGGESCLTQMDFDKVKELLEALNQGSYYSTEPDVNPYYRPRGYL